MISAQVVLLEKVPCTKSLRGRQPLTERVEDVVFEIVKAVHVVAAGGAGELGTGGEALFDPSVVVGVDEVAARSRSRDQDAKRRGTVAERYRLLHLVSAGANTWVFDATDTDNGRPVTLKLLQPEISQSPSFRHQPWSR